MVFALGPVHFGIPAQRQDHLLYSYERLFFLSIYLGIRR